MSAFMYIKISLTQNFTTKIHTSMRTMHASRLVGLFRLTVETGTRCLDGSTRGYDPVISCITTLKEVASKWVNMCFRSYPGPTLCHHQSNDSLTICHVMTCAYHVYIMYNTRTHTYMHIYIYICISINKYIYTHVSTDFCYLTQFSPRVSKEGRVYCPRWNSLQFPPDISLAARRWNHCPMAVR